MQTVPIDGGAAWTAWTSPRMRQHIIINVPVLGAPRSMPTPFENVSYRRLPQISGRDPNFLSQIIFAGHIPTSKDLSESDVL